MSEMCLVHHGILGQKWGIRRFQPYPSGEKVKGGKEVGQATKVKEKDNNKNKFVTKFNKIIKNPKFRLGLTIAAAFTLSFTLGSSLQKKRFRNSIRTSNINRNNKNRLSKNNIIEEDNPLFNTIKNSSIIDLATEMYKYELDNFIYNNKPIIDVPYREIK